MYEGGSVAFDGSLTKFDGTNNYKSVTVSENKIEATDEIDGISFAFDVMSGGYSIQSASGYYIGNDSDSNGISYSKENKYLNTINNGVVKCKGDIALQVFVQGGTKPQTNFKYYKSSQKAIALYKRSESLPKAPFITLTPESGSVAADATSASFAVKSNVDWTVSTDASWVTLGTTSGSNDGTVALSFTTNDGTKERVAVIAVSSADGKVSNTYTLTQKFPGSTSTPLIVTYDFTKISGFNDWGSSYTKHVVKYDVADVVFSSANKNTGTITDRPVTKGQPICVVMSAGKTIKSVKLICKQWGTKSQTITLNTSTDGGTNYTATTTKSSNFTLSASDIADGVNAVKFTFSSTSNQVGISSLELTYTE